VERLSPDFILATKFPSKGDALEARDRISEYTARLQKEGYSPNIFARSFISGAGTDKRWHVLVAGARPDRNIKEQIEQYLSSGEPASLSMDAFLIVFYRMEAELDGWMGGWRRGPKPDLGSGPFSDHN